MQEVAKEGTMLNIITGGCSEIETLGLYKVLKTFTPTENLFLESGGNTLKEIKENYIKGLIREGFISPVEFSFLHFRGDWAPEVWFYKGENKYE